MEKALDKLLAKCTKLLQESDDLKDEDGMLAIKDMLLFEEKTQQVRCLHYAIRVLGER